MIVQQYVRNKVECGSPSDVSVYKVEGFDSYDFGDLGVTSQFLEDAETYFEKYTKPDHFKWLYERALESIAPRSAAEKCRILDIGTGGGNSVFAIYELLKNVEILGVDISEPLLEMCSKVARNNYQMPTGTMELLCADLYDLDIEEESFDLITGSSILHHMIRPEQIVEKVLHALKPGGSAIFTEPFENGHGILAGIYNTIVSIEPSQKKKIPADLKKYMSDYNADFVARRGVGDIRDYTQYLDDKWFFTLGWFEQIARQTDCNTIKVVPTHSGEDIFWKQFKAASTLHNGADAETLPQWAREIFAAFDGSLSRRQVDEICFTGIVVITK